MKPVTRDSLGFMLADVSRLLRRSFEIELAGSSINITQARTLAYVSRHEGIRQIDLAELLEIQPIRVARLVDDLEDMQLVERRPSADDRRAWHIYARPAAAKVLAQFEVTAAAIRDEATRGISQTEVKGLMKLLEQMRGNLHVMQGKSAFDHVALAQRNDQAKIGSRKNK